MLGNIYDHELSGEDDWLYRKISNESLPSVDLRKMSTDEWKSHAAEIRKMLHEEKTTKKPIIGPGPEPSRTQSHEWDWNEWSSRNNPGLNYEMDAWDE